MYVDKIFQTFKGPPNSVASGEIFHAKLVTYKGIKEIARVIDDAAKLKPDHLAAHTSSAPTQWHDVMVIEGVNLTQRELLVQTASYARARFAVGCNRWFVPALILKHDKMTAIVAIFHRGEILRSTDLQLDCAEGAQEFIRLLGEHLARISLPVVGEREVVGSPYCERNSVRGRATLVQRVRRLQDDPSLSATLDSRFDAIAIATAGQICKASASDRNLRPRKTKPTNPAIAIKSPEPETTVLDDAEISALQSRKGDMIVKILLCHPTMPFAKRKSSVA
ncbi:hypothetical protein BV25DRAFT_284635 [Artomyces pyxidatus]|uniref:Uncharacterized protein n=1 Tax=Artomyces pyxidatus TaxID=48021 RepID=A0ACB8SF86_9AGAM|nr:hypothetical protein BV25DRAFT_284635 [Artomyces pyxidatus]